MTIVDTTVWVDYLNSTANPQTIWLGREFGQTQLGLADLILCEVLQGLKTEAAAKRVARFFSPFDMFQLGGEAIAIDSAANYRILRRRGYTIRKTIDCLIATFCIQHDYSLLHHDHDFDPFEKHLGLQVIHPHFEGIGPVHLQ